VEGKLPANCTNYNCSSRWWTLPLRWEQLIHARRVSGHVCVGKRGRRAPKRGRSVGDLGMMNVAAIAVTMSVALWCGTAQSVAGSVGSNETSAAEQLGLRVNAKGLITQTVARSASGLELFGFDLSVAPGSVRCSGPADRGYLGFRRPRGSLELVGRLDALATPAVVGGGREAVVIYTRDCLTKQEDTLPYTETEVPLERLQLVTGVVGRRPTTARVLSAIVEPNRTRIAASPSGSLAVAWLAPHGSNGPHTEVIDRLYVSIGNTSGSMRPPEVFSVGGNSVTAVHLAWVGRDELLVVYTVRDRIFVRTWRPYRGFDKPQLLGEVQFKVIAGGEAVIAVGPSGRAVVAWSSQNITADGVFSPLQVFATIRTSANARFGIAHLLDEGPPPMTTSLYTGGGGWVAASIADDDVTTIAWVSEQDNLDPPEARSVRAVVFDSSGDIQPVQELAGYGTALTLTETPEGGTLLQWKDGEKLDQALRPSSGESFGPPQVAASKAGLIDSARLIDSATGE
jgi:hypothetical protein